MINILPFTALLPCGKMANINAAVIHNGTIIIIHRILSEIIVVCYE
jgi:hypothetical protein